MLIWEAGLAVGQYGTIFIWATLITAYFFPRRIAALHLGWLLLVYAAALAVVENTGGYSPVTRWIFTAVSLTVVMLFINSLVSRRQRADTRARHFFDLSHDMLCTMDMHGRCIEVNAAWQRSLGYRPDEMRGKRLLDFTHPDDHSHATREAMQVFSGGVSDEPRDPGQGEGRQLALAADQLGLRARRERSSTPVRPTSPSARRTRSNARR